MATTSASDHVRWADDLARVAAGLDETQRLVEADLKEAAGKKRDHLVNANYHIWEAAQMLQRAGVSLRMAAKATDET